MSNQMILNETSYLGEGALNHLPDELQRRGLERVLLVTDSSLVKLGLSLKVTNLLAKKRIVYQVFDRVKENPTISSVKIAVEMAVLFRCDAIVAVGGGSVIDCAKAVSLIVTNPDYVDVRSLEGCPHVKNPGIPVFALSTLSGSGSDVSHSFVITDEDRQRKIVCIDRNCIPKVSITDPELYASVPQKQCGYMGLSIISMAVEALLSKNSWAFTDMYALEAIRQVAENLPSAVKNSARAREQIAYAQCLAGIAAANSSLALAHGMAHTLCVVCDIPHAVTVSMLLPAVMRFNAPSSGSKYKDIALALGAKVSAKASPAEYRKSCVNAVEKFFKEYGLPKKLSALGVEAEDLAPAAENAARDYYSLQNPKEASKKKILEIYKSLM